MAYCMQRDNLHTLTPVSSLHRWILALLMLATVALGWYWPVFGFLVPASMAAGIAGAFLRGRYVCGNLCPRGSFFDTLFRLAGGTRRTPAILSNLYFRWGVMAVLMSFMAYQIAQDPGDPMHWGSVFWQVCVLTTAVGVVLGRIYRARTWCAFCPVGTMANAIGGEKDPLAIAVACKGCGSCENACPMDLSIPLHREAGVLPHRDCLKCSSCANACPVNALSFTGKAKQLTAEPLTEEY